MLKIRLQRVGRKNDPSFRVVLTDSKNATRSNKFHEILGSFDARKGEPVLNAERVKYWISVGAKPSGTVHNLLVGGKIIEGKKVNVLSKKSPIRPEAVKEEATATA
jgi:small subunit ribosomal protein S16